MEFFESGDPVWIIHEVSDNVMLRGAPLPVSIKIMQGLCLAKIKMYGWKFEKKKAAMIANPTWTIFPITPCFLFLWFFLQSGSVNPF